ncbi:NAD-dependent epimerase/dehydratase family protein [Ornithinimicrobium sp. INDO-MA30-4]|uniref:NAD-dependent epimerase/dehydratase family protein n=1 Tax=Ornithinimicrobium sp. INDO-MA30-4 TaxID=2908651 RepID=UPI00288348ED|nr:NAD-dependent epimerase/dehydratase family protein [Ornithinimicrobium sp. INDO-MA30-4]
MLATAQGALTPYPLENDLSAVSGVQDVAVVGVGPVGTQQVVVVVVPQGRLSRGDSAIAEPDLAARVRDAASVPVAAVLVKDWLPVDIRHASKVDRTALAAWASDQLQPAGIRERVARAPRNSAARPAPRVGRRGQAMKVLVTGASGMLGGAVADLLAERGDDVTVMQRRTAGGRHRERLGDIGDADDVDRAVADHDAIIHLAAKVNVTGRWSDYARTNIGGTHNIVSAAQRHGVHRLVQVSSPSVAHSGRSISGDGANPADPRSARGNYARSKAAAELLALHANSDELAVTTVRPHLVWGPGDTQLVGRIVARAKSGRLPLIGSGAALVDTTYVDNAASAMAAALDRAEFAAGRAWS